MVTSSIKIRGAKLKSGVHNLFVISGRIPFIFMNYGRQWVRGILLHCSCSASTN